MAENSIFEVLVLLGRPAAGKSEIIDHLKNTKLSERVKKYHIGEIDVLDDFPILWTWFEEDDILSQRFQNRACIPITKDILNTHIYGTC